MTSSFINKAVQNALNNFELQLIISLLERPKLIKSKCLKKAWAHYLIDHISVYLIGIMCFENLQITNIRVLNPSAFTRKVRTKSRVKVKTKIEGDLIDYREL